MSDHLTVMTPVIPGARGAMQIELARAIACSPGDRAIALGIVEVPEERSLSEGVTVAQRRRRLLRRMGAAGDSETDVEVLVRASRGLEEGIREAAREKQVDRLVVGWRGPVRSDLRLARSTLDPLIISPPCDLMVFKPARATTAGAPVHWPPKRILIPVRGGPHADLALSTARRVARHFDAGVTVMRIVPRGRGATSVPAPGEIVVESDLVEEAIVQEAERHDLLIIGASARGPRTTHLFGFLPERIAERVSCGVLIVKTAQPVSPAMFGEVGHDLHALPVDAAATISTVVDQWFAEITFHSHEFANLADLMRLKEHQKVRISLALPALNEEATIGRIIGTIKSRLLDEVRLLDEIVLVDSDSTDGTVAIAESMGVPVYRHREILPEEGTYTGKGEALWKSLSVTTGDIVVWIDSDITDIHPKFVYGLVGPLLSQTGIDFVKGYYRRPLNLGTNLLTTGGGRVTELTARPLINLFYPLLSGLVQPLAGEMAGRRSLLETLPFFTGYGVETGLLIDILERYGLDHIAQCDLENRIHRNQDMISLSKMAFAIVQVVIRRLEDQRHIRLLEDINTTMKLIHYSPEELFLELKEIREYERKPMLTVADYAARHHPATAAVGS